MRIIVTVNGKEIEKEIEDENELKKNKTAMTCFQGFRKNRFIKPRIESPNDPKKRMIDFDTIALTTKRNWTSDKKNIFNKTSPNFHPSTPKVTTFNIKKGSGIPNSGIYHLYSNEGTDQRQGIIIGQKDSLPEIKDFDIKKAKNERLTLEEILGRKKIFELKKDLVDRNRMKEKLSKIDENCFRSTYQRFTDLEKLDAVLKHKSIFPDHSHLIRFIDKDKKDMGTVACSRIIGFDKEKMFKMNKICQTVLVNKEQSKLIEGAIEHKLDYKHTKEKMKTTKYLNRFDAGLKRSENILKDYIKYTDEKLKEKDRKERYRENYRDIKKIWDKELGYYQELCGKKEYKKKKDVNPSSFDIDFD